MKKEDIYQIIGYNGQYDIKVKKALRKLLKDNHPDNGGNKEKFILINEVKKELEENKISYHFDKKKVVKNINDIDYEFCIYRKKELEKQKKEYEKQYQNIKECLKMNIEKYHLLYQTSLSQEVILNTVNDKSYFYLKLIYFIIFLLILFLVFFLITEKNYYLIILGIFLVILLIIVRIFYIYTKKTTMNQNNNFDNYQNIVNEINTSKKIKDELKKQKLELEHKINRINNDIRFYNNIINNE